MTEKIFDNLKNVLKTDIFKNYNISSYLVLNLACQTDYFYIAKNEKDDNIAQDAAIKLGIPFCIIGPDKPTIFIKPIFTGLVIFQSYIILNNLKQLKLFEDIQLNEENQGILRKHSFLISSQSKLNQLIPASEILIEANISKYSIGGISLNEDNLNLAYNKNKGNLNDLLILISYLKQQVRDNLGIQLIEAFQYQS